MTSERIVNLNHETFHNRSLLFDKMKTKEVIIERNAQSKIVRIIMECLSLSENMAFLSLIYFKKTFL